MTISPCIAWVRELEINLWWAQVTENPDDSKIIVFNRGMAKGFSTVIPVGGQEHPISGVGAKLL